VLRWSGFSWCRILWLWWWKITRGNLFISWTTLPWRYNNISEYLLQYEASRCVGRDSTLNLWQGCPTLEILKHDWSNALTPPQTPEWLQSVLCISEYCIQHKSRGCSSGQPVGQHNAGLCYRYHYHRHILILPGKQELQNYRAVQEHGPSGRHCDLWEQWSMWLLVMWSRSGLGITSRGISESYRPMG
jgi:hypothetical protein